MHVSKKLTYMLLKIALAASRTGRHVPQHGTVSDERRIIVEELKKKLMYGTFNHFSKLNQAVYQ